jgi:hypothetical protein
VKRAAVWTGAALLGGLAAWQAASALQDTPEAKAPTSPVTASPAPAAEQSAATEATPAPSKAKPSAPLPDSRIVTPMADRVATIGVLNKRNGLSRDLTMKPGDAVRIGDLVVRLRACEATAPWEPERWTGAFVQVITRETRTSWRKTFSGWLYKESPSINVVEHPIYDVWVKACKMRHPDIGPDTIVARGDDAGGASGSRSKAVKSAPVAVTAPSAPDSAADSATE